MEVLCCERERTGEKSSSRWCKCYFKSHFHSTGSVCAAVKQSRSLMAAAPLLPLSREGKAKAVRHSNPFPVFCSQVICRPAHTQTCGYPENEFLLQYLTTGWPLLELKHIQAVHLLFLSKILLKLLDNGTREDSSWNSGCYLEWKIGKWISWPFLVIAD